MSLPLTIRHKIEEELQPLLGLILKVEIRNHNEPLMTLMHVLLLENVSDATNPVIFQISVRTDEQSIM